MHKMGLYRLRINYGVVQITQYLYNFASSTLECLIDKEDKPAVARFFNSYKCR